MHRADASGGLEADARARLLVVLADGLAHGVGGLGRGGGLLLAGAGLDEVGPGIHGQYRGFLHVLHRAEGAGFEDDFQRALLARLLQFLNFVAHGLVVSGKELTYGDDDVYLVGALHDGHGGFGHLHFGEGLRRGEAAADAGDVHVLHFEGVAHYLGEDGTKEGTAIAFPVINHDNDWASKMPWTVVDKGDTRVSLTLIDTPESYKSIPYHFEVMTTYV